MLLYEFIEVLEKLPQDAIAKDGFGNPDSYRGYYDQLAFEKVSDISISDMLKLATNCVGKTFFGYKGGEYIMHGLTPVWVSKYGETGEELTSAHIDLMKQSLYSLKRVTVSVEEIKAIAVLSPDERATIKRKIMKENGTRIHGEAVVVNQALAQCSANPSEANIEACIVACLDTLVVLRELQKK